MANTHPLRAYRDREKLKLREVAAELGVKPNTVWRWEKGERRPEDRYLPALSRMTGASINALLGLPEATRAPEPAEAAE